MYFCRALRDQVEAQGVTVRAVLSPHLPLAAWFHEAEGADWANPAQVKEQYATASILKNGRVVFNIGGNEYRLVVRINYAYRVVYVRFAGTHSEYDQIDAEQM